MSQFCNFQKYFEENAEIVNRIEGIIGSWPKTEVFEIPSEETINKILTQPETEVFEIPSEETIIKMLKCIKLEDDK